MSMSFFVLFLMLSSCSKSAFVFTPLQNAVVTDGTGSSSSSGPTVPGDLTTNMGGNGDQNLLAPAGKSLFFNLEAAQTRSSLSRACAQAPQSQSLRPLHRLSKLEYQNTLRDLLGIILNSSLSTSVMSGLSDELAMLPEDLKSPHGDFLANSDKNVNDNHMRAYMELAIAVSKKIEENKTLAFGTCAATSVSATCFSSFLDTKAQSIFRKPLSTDDKTFYNNVFTTKGLSVAVAALFMAPGFLYHAEIQNGEGTNSFNLNAWELASKLSYALWGTMPDATLFSKAANGDLLDSVKYRAEALRVFQDSKARAHLKVFVKEWLKLEEVPLIDLSNPPTAYLWKTAQGAPATLDASAIRQQSIDEVLDLVEYYVYDAPTASKRLSGLMLSRLSTAGDKLKQALYQNSLPGNRGATTAGGQWFEFADLSRKGILNRAAFQMIDGRARRPILKGVKVLDRILCRPVPSPEDNSSPAGVVLEDDFSARQRVAAITELPGTSCLGCHANINPIGYAFEGFDPFGRKAPQEHVIDPSALNPTSSVAIKAADTETEFSFSAGKVQLSNSADFADAVAESFEFHKCFSRFWWRHVNRRADVTADSCHIEETYKVLEDNNEGLPRGMLEAVLHPNFKKRLRE